MRQQAHPASDGARRDTPEAISDDRFRAGSDTARQVGDHGDRERDRPVFRTRQSCR